MSQYVNSMPARLEAYRSLREHELEIMQWVAEQLQAEMPVEPVENLERSIKNALLMLRCCAMAMLLNDESFVHTRLVTWLAPRVTAYNSQNIDSTLYGLMNHRLNQVLGSDRMAVLTPLLTYAQTALPTAQPTAAVEGEVAIGW